MQTRGMLKRRRPSPPSPKSGEVQPLIQSTFDSKATSNSDATPATVRSTCSPPTTPHHLRKNSSFRIAKWMMLRLLAAVYFFAFLGAYNQNGALIGTDGLVPATPYLTALRRRYPDSPLQGFKAAPTLFWWIDYNDWNLDMFAISGMCLSLMLLFIDSWLILALLWIIDFSIVTVAGGGSFYSYGWESQLLETTFIAIFLCDLPSISRIREGNGGRWKWRLESVWRDKRKRSEENISEPSIASLWLMRWLCFRISTGAGLIKIRGGSCWQQKTCLWYHFETQPIPSPSSFFFHFLPKSVLSRAVDLDLFVQLYTSWMVMIPGIVGRIGGLIQAAFMVNIILSGNFAFLNHLTIVPALACLDDGCWPSWMTQRVLRKTKMSAGNRLTNDIVDADQAASVKITGKVHRILIDLIVTGLIGYLSIPVVANLLQWDGSHQQMNASFNSFRLVNTYGAFGSVGHARYEPIITVSSDGTEWHEIEFPCKPGRVSRRPCFCAPYHYRLDWNVWFIGFKPHQQMLRSRETWLYGLLSKILSGERGIWLNLLDKSAEAVIFGSNSDDTTRTIKFARADMYEYKMAYPLWEILGQIMQRKEIVWWSRSFEEELIPPVVLDQQRRKLRDARDLLTPKQRQEAAPAGKTAAY